MDLDPMPASGTVRRYRAVALDLMLPSACAGCESSGGPFCPSCAAACRVPVRRVNRGLRFGPLPPCTAAVSYVDPIRSALIAYKEHGRRELATPLGAALARAAGAAWSITGRPGEGVALIPVPSSATAARSRGGDHVAALARVAARCLRGAGVPAQAVRVLRQRAGVRDSVGLGPDERAANLDGAFSGRRLHPRIGASAVIVVDDIVTTGATLAEVTASLRALGSPASACAVIAAVTRSDHRDRVQIGGMRG